MSIFKNSLKRITVCVCLTLQMATQVLAQSGTAEVRPSDIAGRANAENAPANAPIDPQLAQILKTWENKTKGITKLSGTHRRFVYDSVFEVEKRADGKFYYESPDKGRIDIEVVKIGKNEQSQKIGKSGKPYDVKSDIPEKWICNGKRIAQADDLGKTYSAIDIPKEHQGRNIMDGPLPFLFGLPAEVAMARYHITVLQSPDERLVRLEILPKREVDAANWSSAEVMLHRETYLPFAVKMLDHSKNRETVYRFADLKPNGFSLPIFGHDPFNIEKELRGHKEIKSGNQNEEGIVQQPGARPAGAVPDRPPVTIPKENISVKPATGVTMPDVSNYPWKTLKEFFEAKGFVVEFRKAKPAPTPEMVYAIAGQSPKAGEDVKPGQTVIFWLYDEIKTAEKP